MAFSDDFIWGAATAAYQIEGAAFEDGKGLSIWDALCEKKGAIQGGETGVLACDHYHRFREDAALMGEIGLQAYRMSISWPRVLPSGIGTVNEKGLDFYDRLTDELLKLGIQPWITLYHWDYPYALFLKGGWLNRDTVDWFADYARIVAERLSDRVTNWITLNEIQGFVGYGYAGGGKILQAPAMDLPTREVLLVGHHALMAHGKAVAAIRSVSRKKANIGAAPVGMVKIPASDRDADIAAAYHGMFAITGGKDDFFKERSNSWWMDPVCLGRYPEDGLAILGDLLPSTFEEDLRVIYQPLDYFGVNIYSGEKCGGDGSVNPPPGGSDFFSVPESLYWGPKFYYERYKLPVIIAENDISCRDAVSLDGKIHDSQRIDFIHRYLLELRRAAEDGIPVKGYFHWALMDNFEWCGGYTPRFGLIYVDYSTQKRTLKDSAGWYKEVIHSNGKNL